jgi:hypothetical protein
MRLLQREDRQPDEDDDDDGERVLDQPSECEPRLAMLLKLRIDYRHPFLIPLKNDAAGIA